MVGKLKAKKKYYYETNQLPYPLGWGYEPNQLPCPLGLGEPNQLPCPLGLGKNKSVIPPDSSYRDQGKDIQTIVASVAPQREKNNGKTHHTG